MPSRGPALTFEPRYVNFVIHAWQDNTLSALQPAELAAAASALAAERFVQLNRIGLYEEQVSSTQIARAIGLLKSLKLAKQTMTGAKGAKIAMITPTALGREVLSEPLVASAIRPLFVEQLVASSPELSTLLHALDERGPIVVPTLSPVPGASRRGSAYITALEDGLAQFWAQMPHAETVRARRTSPAAPAGRKPTPAQLVKFAQAEAVTSSAGAQVKSFDTVVAVASDLGLLWEDVEQLNMLVASRSIGLAARQRDSRYSPNVPTWHEVGEQFTEALVTAHASRADGSGFAPIGALRGALGKALHIASPVADALICQARDEGDRGMASVRLYFVENEDKMYARDRHPLLWRGRAFDFVEVRVLEGSALRSVHTNAEPSR